MDIRGQSFAVNGVTVDFGGETLRAESGHAVALRPQAFSVLRYMAERAGRLVTKDELMNAVWPGLVVTDDSLVQCIHEIRRALQDDGRAVLKTAPKRGYLLDLPADLAFAEASSSAPPENLDERAKVHIAVLPFANMSSDPEQDYFANGITEDVITDLSQWRTITVASRYASLRLQGEPVNIRAAAHELGVTFLVEGSVRRLGSRLRITAQLVDARTGNHVWAERYDRPFDDLPALQDEVVRKIVGTLVGRMYLNEAEHLSRRPPTNPAAYDLTLRANWLKWNDPSTRAEAKRCLERAIELDPGYGLPHSLLALTLLFDYRDCAKSPEILDRAFALAKRGVELADNDSTCHVALGRLYWQRRSFDLALSHTERAIAINPANPTLKADLGSLLSRIGRAEEGLERLREAQIADPFFGPGWFWQALGLAQFVLRRYPEALLDFERQAPTTSDTSAIMAGCCAKLGLIERAKALVADCLAVQPEATLSGLVDRVVFARAQDSEHLAECLRLAGMPG